MATAVEWALGDYVEMGNGATPTETFQRIPEVRNITFNLGTRTKADATSHDSTKPFREFVPTFLEGGTINLEGNELPQNAIQVALEAHRSDDAPTTFRVIAADDDGHDVVFTGKAYVTSYNRTRNFDDARRFTATLEPTGLWVRTTES